MGVVNVALHRKSKLAFLRDLGKKIDNFAFFYQSRALPNISK